jgi:hypothetical protein
MQSITLDIQVRSVRPTLLQYRIGLVGYARNELLHLLEQQGYL